MEVTKAEVWAIAAATETTVSVMCRNTINGMEHKGGRWSLKELTFD